MEVGVRLTRHMPESGEKERDSSSRLGLKREETPKEEILEPHRPRTRREGGILGKQK